MEQARIPVAVAPGEAAWAVDAIRRGGGEPVGLGEKPSGLVWTDPGAVEELRDVLRAGVLSLGLLAAYSLADGQRKGLFYGDDAGQLAVQAR